jgi:hypothetical protein
LNLYFDLRYVLLVDLLQGLRRGPATGSRYPCHLSPIGGVSGHSCHAGHWCRGILLLWASCTSQGSSWCLLRAVPFRLPFRGGFFRSRCYCYFFSGFLRGLLGSALSRPCCGSDPFIPWHLHG